MYTSLLGAYSLLINDLKLTGLGNHSSMGKPARGWLCNCLGSQLGAEVDTAPVLLTWDLGIFPSSLVVAVHSHRVAGTRAAAQSGLPTTGLVVLHCSLATFQFQQASTPTSSAILLSHLRQIFQCRVFTYHMELVDRYPRMRSVVLGWFGGSTGLSQADEIAQQAFETAKAHIANELVAPEREAILGNQFASMQDFKSALSNARSKYESRKTSKAYIWLEKLSSRVVYYETVLDVLVQHNPEYVSLVWGTFKFLFVVGYHLLPPSDLQTFRPWDDGGALTR